MFTGLMRERIFLHKYKGEIIPIEWHPTKTKTHFWRDGYRMTVIGKYNYIRFTGVAEVINGQMEHVNDVKRMI